MYSKRLAIVIVCFVRVTIPKEFRYEECLVKVGTDFLMFFNYRSVNYYSMSSTNRSPWRVYILNRSNSKVGNIAWVIKSHSNFKLIFYYTIFLQYFWLLHWCRFRCVTTCSSYDNIDVCYYIGKLSLWSLGARCMHARAQGDGNWICLYWVKFKCEILNCALVTISQHSGKSRTQDEFGKE